MAPPNSRSFSVSVVLPASGCEMIAKVRRRSTSAASGVWATESAGSGMCIRRMWQRKPSGSRAATVIVRARRRSNPSRKSAKQALDTPLSGERRPELRQASQRLRVRRLRRQREQSDIALEQGAIAGDLQRAGLLERGKRHAPVDRACKRLLIARDDHVGAGGLTADDGQAALGQG